MDDSKIISAKDAEIGKTYLVILSPTSVYKIIIKSISESGVCIDDERYPGQANIVVSAETLLTEFDQDFYDRSRQKKAAAAAIKKEEKQEEKKEDIKDKPKKTIKESKKMSQNKNPRSKVIDKLLAASPTGVAPNWEELVDEVIKQGKATTEERQKVLFQAKIRYKWYSSGEKVNPASKEIVKAQE